MTLTSSIALATAGETTPRVEGLPNNPVLPELVVRRKLGLSKITLHRMRQREDAGGLPYVRLSPGRIGYLQSDVEAFLAARRVGALPPSQRDAA